MKDRKALIIEDNLNWYKFFTEVIIKSPMNLFQFSYAADLKSGLEIIKNEDIEIIILDLMLPDSSGLNTVAQTVECAKYTPIIVLTTTDSEIMSEAAMQYGIEDYLVKDQYDERMFFHVVSQAIMRVSVKLKKDLYEMNNNLNRIFEMQKSIDNKLLNTLTVQDKSISNVTQNNSELEVVEVPKESAKP